MLLEKGRLENCVNLILRDLENQSKFKNFINNPEYANSESELYDVNYEVKPNDFSSFISIIHSKCKKNGIHFELNLKSPRKKVFALFHYYNGESFLITAWSNVGTKKLGENKLSQNKIVLSFLNSLRNCKKNIARFLPSFAFFVPIIGPDGVGKGALQLSAVEKMPVGYEQVHFKSLYVIKYLYRFRLTFIKNWRSFSRDVADEKIGHYIFWVSLISLFILRIRKKNLILLDRYFIDFFASPVRVESLGKLPRKILLIKFYVRIMPIPESLIVLGCKFETLVERKNELTKEGVEMLERITFSLITDREIPNILFISTEDSLHNTSNILARKLTFIKQQRCNY